MIRHLYTLWSDHPTKSRGHLTPFIVITVLLTVYSMLHTISSLSFNRPSPKLTAPWSLRSMVLESSAHGQAYVFFTFICSASSKVPGTCFSFRVTLPPGDIWQCLEASVVFANGQRGCHRHIVGRSQQYCPTTCNAQGGFLQQILPIVPRLKNLVLNKFMKCSDAKRIPLSIPRCLSSLAPS